MSSLIDKDYPHKKRTTEVFDSADLVVAGIHGKGVKDGSQRKQACPQRREFMARRPSIKRALTARGSRSSEQPITVGIFQRQRTCTGQRRFRDKVRHAMASTSYRERLRSCRLLHHRIAECFVQRRLVTHAWTVTSSTQSSMAYGSFWIQ